MNNKDFTYEEFCNISDGKYEFSDGLMSEKDLSKAYLAQDHKILKDQLKIHLMAKSVDSSDVLIQFNLDYLKNPRMVPRKPPPNTKRNLDIAFSIAEMLKAGMPIGKIFDELSWHYNEIGTPDGIRKVWEKCEYKDELKEAFS